MLAKGVWGGGWSLHIDVAVGSEGDECECGGGLEGEEVVGVRDLGCACETLG
jgi:hypothetical protein